MSDQEERDRILAEARAKLQAAAPPAVAALREMYRTTKSEKRRAQIKRDLERRGYGVDEPATESGPAQEGDAE